jgi:hypothetical protein
MKRKLLLVVWCACTCSCGPKFPEQSRSFAEQDENSANAEFVTFAAKHNFIFNLSSLPESGTADHIYWSDSNWPSYLGGISWRWNDPSAARLDKRPEITRKQVEHMSMVERAKLSPAEKYDAFMGWFGAGSTDWASRLEFLADEEPWAGICGGWSSAVINFAEPAPVTVRGPSGIEIPFGSSDVKALLSMHMENGVLAGELGVERGFEIPDIDDATEVFAELMLGVGKDCDISEDPATCEDVSPAMFHLTLANIVGIAHDGFVLDVKTDKRRYYQPVYSFKAEKQAQTKHGDTVTIRYNTEVTTAVDLAEKAFTGDFDYSNPNNFSFTVPRFEPNISGGHNAMTTRVFSYELTISRGGDIVSSKWLSTERPDSFFKMKKIDAFKGHFRGLAEIYRADK